jgi:hypothetical protein
MRHPWSAAPATLLASFEKFAQCRRIRLAGARFDGVDVGGTQLPQEFRLVFGPTFRECATLAIVVRIDFELLTRFSILQYKPPDHRQLQFESVNNLDRDDIMAAIGLAQGRKRARAERRGN